MRLVYWNIRAGGGKRKDGIFAQLLAWQPDIIGLGEFRGTPASQALAAQLAEAGWRHQIQSTHPEKLATNALLLASKMPLEQLVVNTQPDEAQRWILANVAHSHNLTVGLTHVLNYTSKRKYPMLDAIVQTMSTWGDSPCIIGGDTNCGKTGIDEEKPPTKIYKGEHAFMLSAENTGWVDGFRHLHGDAREFTWYSHKNNGFRLDHAFLNPTITPKLKAIRHEWGHDPNQPNRREALSDHAALIIDLH